MTPPKDPEEPAKRYAIDCKAYGNHSCGLREDEKGYIVKIDDYNALMAKAEAADRLSDVFLDLRRIIIDEIEVPMFDRLLKSGRIILAYEEKEAAYQEAIKGEGKPK